MQGLHGFDGKVLEALVTDGAGEAGFESAMDGFAVLARAGLGGRMVFELLALLLLFEFDGREAIFRAEFGAKGFHFVFGFFMRSFHMRELFGSSD